MSPDLSVLDRPLLKTCLFFAKVKKTQKPVSEFSPSKDQPWGGGGALQLFWERWAQI